MEGDQEQCDKAQLKIHTVIVPNPPQQHSPCAEWSQQDNPQSAQSNMIKNTIGLERNTTIHHLHSERKAFECNCR